METDDQLVRATRVMSDDEFSWIDTYYESLEFFNQEPQHIGRKSYANAQFRTLSEVKTHLRGIEVTLNQNLQQFFSLAPYTLRNRLFEEIFHVRFDQPWTMLSSDVDVEFALENCMQPDILFESKNEVVSLEMKVGAKCSIDQVLKYALLGLSIEIQRRCEKTHFLAILAPGTLASQFPQHFSDIHSLKDAVVRTDLSAFLSKKPEQFRKQQARLEAIVGNLQLAFINYKQLGDHLRKDVPPTSDSTPGSEVYRKLVSGLIGEFRRRKLA
jgi:hypothetical protein